jgi:hypothetical protein
MAGLVGLASPASAAVAVNLTVSNGTIGVSQGVAATVTTDLVGSPTGTVTFLANGQLIGAQSIGGSAGSTANVLWTPTTSGSVVVQADFVGADGSTASNTSTVGIARVETASSITTPGTAATSTTVPLLATVRSRQGQYVPTGSVTFRLTNGTVLGSANLDNTGKATINYTTPGTAQTVSMFVVYAGDGNANSSQSANDSIKVSTTTSTVQLIVAQTNYVNTAVTVTAQITPASATGSVDFSVNGKYLSTAKVSSGKATITWVPNALGTFTLTAKYSGSGSVKPGSASNSVQVIEQLKQDQINLVASGSSGAWVPGTTATLTNGSDVTITATAASGAPVALAVAGPCSLNGNVLHVNGVGGTCQVTASTAGGNGYAPTSLQYNVQTTAGAQTATVQAPKSGSYKKGSKLKLAKTNAVTNLNQPIKWKVTKGGSHCKVIKDSGWYKLNLVKKGKCTVVGSAPAISNQWSSYQTTRNYTVK